MAPPQGWDFLMKSPAKRFKTGEEKRDSSKRYEAEKRVRFAAGGEQLQRLAPKSAAALISRGYRCLRMHDVRASRRQVGHKSNRHALLADHRTGSSRTQPMARVQQSGVGDVLRCMPEVCDDKIVFC
uniref:Zinc finger protein 862 n=2 Tax=Nothobranchius rachovii TaxID=451742 RepID=A0A1A8SBA8_9TELE